MGIEIIHVNVPSIMKAQKMPAFPSPLDVEAKARIAGFEFPPSPFWVSFPGSWR